jgi:hypothetical protein
MKKLSLILLILLSLSFISIIIHAEEVSSNNENQVTDSTQGTVEPDFRKTNWGMTKEEVKPTESGELSKESENELIYKATLLDIKAEVHYIFKDKKLITAYYMKSPLISQGTWEQIYNDYDAWKNALIKKYGKPVDDREIWKKPAAKFQNLNPAQQVGNCNLTLVTEWLTDKTVIQYVWDRKNTFDTKSFPTIYYYDKQNYKNPSDKKNDTTGF